MEFVVKLSRRARNLYALCIIQQSPLHPLHPCFLHVHVGVTVPYTVAEYMCLATGA
jgi:hypothetical protein